MRFDKQRFVDELSSVLDFFVYGMGPFLLLFVAGVGSIMGIVYLITKGL